MDSFEDIHRRHITGSVPLAGLTRPPTVQGPVSTPAPHLHPSPASAFRSARGPLLPIPLVFLQAPPEGFEPSHTV